LTDIYRMSPFGNSSISLTGPIVRRFTIIHEEELYYFDIYRMSPFGNSSISLTRPIVDSPSFMRNFISSLDLILEALTILAF
jgi:hypothetical protein